MSNNESLFNKPLFRGGTITRRGGPGDYKPPGDGGEEPKDRITDELQRAMGFEYFTDDGQDLNLRFPTSEPLPQSVD